MSQYIQRLLGFLKSLIFSFVAVTSATKVMFLNRSVCRFVSQLDYSKSYRFIVILYAGNFVAGKFRFRFWDFGKWRKIAVDDRLPTVRDQNGVNHLIFARNSDQPTEFWLSLMEKAFVK